MLLERLPLREPNVPGFDAAFYCLWVTADGRYGTSALQREMYGEKRWHVYKVGGGTAGQSDSGMAGQRDSGVGNDGHSDGGVVHGRM